jgi:hypothetical protein
MELPKIVSGWQMAVDRAALDALQCEPRFGVEIDMGSI